MLHLEVERHFRETLLVDEGAVRVVDCNRECLDVIANIDDDDARIRLRDHAWLDGCQGTEACT